MPPSLPHALESHGFALLPAALTADVCARVVAALDSLPRTRGRGGLRHLLDVPEVAALAAHPAIRIPVEAVVGYGAFAFKATLFEKTAEANWFVGWHQDLQIPVARRIDVPGFSRWSDKDGVFHVQPPVEILEKILAVRVNLDAATPENGSLEILPGSHRFGVLSDDAIDAQTKSAASIPCLTAAGGLVFMRPLVLHASAKTIGPHIRRVLHFEFAALELPGELKWHQRCAM